MESCLRMEIFRKKVIAAVNESQLTVGAVYFIMKDILNDLLNMYKEEVEKDKERANTPMVEESIIPLTEVEEQGEKTLVVAPTNQEVTENEN